MRRQAEEEPDADLDLNADDPEGIGDEGADDPLAGLNEEQRAAVEARTAALVEEQINQFKGNYGRRFGAAIADARSKGLDIGEDGAVLIRDPQAAAKALGITVAQAEQQMQRQEDLDPLDEPIDAFNEDPETTEAKIRRRAEKIADERFNKRFGELEERLARAEGAAYRPINQAVPDLAREALDGWGHGIYAEHPEFAETVTKMAQSMANGDPQALTDPKLVEMAAMAAVTLLKDTLPDDVRARAAETRRGQDPAALAAEARRRALGQTSPSRHTPARGQAFADEDIQAAEALRQEFPESAGRMNPRMAQVLGQEELSIDEWRAAQRKPAGAGR